MSDETIDQTAIKKAESKHARSSTLS